MSGMVCANKGTAAGAHGSCALVANLVSILFSGGFAPLHKLAFIVHHIVGCMCIRSIASREFGMHG